MKKPTLKQKRKLNKHYGKIGKPERHVLDNSQIAFVLGAIDVLTNKIHENALQHGWWKKPRTFAEIIALCHSELSEALEGDRQGNPRSDKVWQISSVEEELADCVIRILDYCGKKKINITKAIAMKMEYNADRPYRHGKRY